MKIPPCLGNTRVNDSSRRWYSPPGQTPNECTYCQLCYETHILGKKADAVDYTSHTGLVNCNCDYASKKNSIEFGVFKIALFNPTDGTNYPVIYDSTGAEVFALPTGGDYAVRVLLIDGIENTYFAIESMKVGTRAVAARSFLMSPRLREIAGYDSLDFASFKFVSLSDQDRADGMMIEEENVGNIVTMTVQRYLRIKREPERPHFPTLGGGEGGNRVGHMQLVRTIDQFEKIDPPMTIRFTLMCDQSEGEKRESNVADAQKAKEKAKEKEIANLKAKEKELANLKAKEKEIADLKEKERILCNMTKCLMSGIKMHEDDIERMRGQLRENLKESAALMNQIHAADPSSTFEIIQ